jgi:hypothetical protein
LLPSVVHLAVAAVRDALDLPWPGDGCPNVVFDARPVVVGEQIRDLLAAVKR